MKRNSLLLLLALFIISVFAGCRYRPKDATLFKVQGKREFDHAFLNYPQSMENRRPLKLKFMDTNSFTTTQTLSPGNYVLSLRTNDGFHFNEPVQIEAEKWLYEIAEPQHTTIAAQATGPKVSGRLYVSSGTMPAEVAVLFIGNDVVMKRSPVENERFTVEAPSADKFRIEVFALGQPPRTWIGENIEVRQAKDLGMITIK